MKNSQDNAAEFVENESCGVALINVLKLPAAVFAG